MSIDLFLDDGRFNPPASYDIHQSRKVFPYHTKFMNPKADPRNYKVNLPYGEEPMDSEEDEKIENAFNIIDEILDILDSSDIKRDSLDITIKYLTQARDKLCSSDIHEEANTNKKCSFKPGDLTFKNGGMIKISKDEAKRFNEILKGAKNREEFYNEVIKTKRDFQFFKDYALKMSEDIFDKERSLDDVTSRWARPDELSDIKRYTGRAIKYGGLTGKAMGATLGGMAGLSIGGIVAAKNAVQDIRRGKVRRRDDRVHQNARFEEKTSEAKLIERFKNR